MAPALNRTTKRAREVAELAELVLAADRRAFSVAQCSLGADSIFDVMACPPSPYAPSSSAVTIPTPGKSILKKPPPTQQSIFARISKFLPTQNSQQTSGDEGKALKRAPFILPELATVYPISALNPPSMPTLKDEKRSIEQRELERRRRVVRGNSINGSGETEEWWSMERVEAFYRECCVSREEHPSLEVSAVLKVCAHSLVRCPTIHMFRRIHPDHPPDRWIYLVCSLPHRWPLHFPMCCPSNGVFGD